MQYFPLFMDLKNKPVLVVGGGEVASRKIETLVRAGAKVTIVSPALTDTLKQLVESGICRWLERKYDSDVVLEYIQVWATTNDAELNHRIYHDAKSKNILVNVVDDKPYCDFITPSMINRGRIQIAISSGGASPVLVRKIREMLEVALPQNLSLLAEFAQNKRDDIKKKYASVEERKRFWERFFFNPQIDQIQEYEKLADIYNSELIQKEYVTVSRVFVEYSDDVENLSIKTLRMMQKAERVLFNADCPFEFVDLCRRDAERMTYTDTDALEQFLSENQTSVSLSDCIFIQKDVWQEDNRLSALVSSGQLLKIAE